VACKHVHYLLKSGTMRITEFPQKEEVFIGWISLGEPVAEAVCGRD
jgi:hypothetical protein